MVNEQGTRKHLRRWAVPLPVLACEQLSLRSQPGHRAYRRVVSGMGQGDNCPLHKDPQHRAHPGGSAWVVRAGETNPAERETPLKERKQQLTVVCIPVFPSHQSVKATIALTLPEWFRRVRFGGKLRIGAALYPRIWNKTTA